MAAPHILLVEDSALVVEALRVLFEETGHRVSVAHTIVDAVSVCLDDPPDVMLLDLGLADGDGLAVLETLARRGVALPRTFALTGRDDAATVARCAAAGCREVLVKPVPTRVLLAKVGEAVGA